MGGESGGCGCGPMCQIVNKAKIFGLATFSFLGSVLSDAELFKTVFLCRCFSLSKSLGHL